MKLLCLTTLALICSVGCARQTVWQVHNATTGPISIAILNEKTPIEAGQSAAVTAEGASFDVVSGVNDWFYTMPTLPETFVFSPFAPWKQRKAAMAVTQDGKIFLLQPETMTLPQTAPKQPQGFPMAPFMNGGENKMTADDLNNAIRK